MSDIKWVKITTDMFDNRKIKYLRKLPDGDKIVLIWVMLLTIAGRCNMSGMLFLTENIPYTANMLADELGFDVNTVILAIDQLDKLGMIIKDVDKLMIANWLEYQSADGMDKVREQTRKRVADYRNRQKLLAEEAQSGCNVTSNDTVTDSSISISPSKSKKKKFIPPTLEEIIEYCKSRNSSVDPYEFYEFFTSDEDKLWTDSNGKPVVNWKQKLITWEHHNRGARNESKSNSSNGRKSEAKRNEWEGLNFYDN